MNKKKILLIDDEVDLTKFLKLNLEKSGAVEVYTANSGPEGIEIAQKMLPDLIFIDILMPEMDGGAVAEILSSKSLTKTIPIVFLTAIARKEEVAAKGGHIGGHRFIAKPVTAEDLLKFIEVFFKDEI